MVHSLLTIFAAFKDQIWYLSGLLICQFLYFFIKSVFYFQSFSFSKLCSSFMDVLNVECVCRNSGSNWKIKLQLLNPCAVKVVQLLRSMKLYIIVFLSIEFFHGCDVLVTSFVLLVCFKYLIDEHM